jgi:hypothetical protein
MLPEPPDCPREFSETPRLKTCGSFWISAVVVSGAASSMSSRETSVTEEPTGAVPRMRLPVTTISSRLVGVAAARGSLTWVQTTSDSHSPPDPRTAA